ncbi:MAG TPA: ScyD/ScyE family protein [Pyrinomonadaceae bacterium]|nr:ScyD/ScyE family protein [Pyrinomonadaceae bacterium]
MNRYIRFFSSLRLLLSLSFTIILLAGGTVNAQCPGVTPVTADLRLPLGITQSNQDNLLVSETGFGAPGTGRISIVDPGGTRRTLLDGIPSGINDVGEPSGPAGLFISGRTLYVAIGVGDVGVAGPVPGTTVPNPSGPSSPLFSSVLAIHFSAQVEKTTTGFTLTADDEQALASGQKVTLSNGGGKITIELVVNFPNFIPNPLPFPGGESNIRLSNPYDLVAVGDQLYVTDGGRNLVWQVDIDSGALSLLAAFPPIPNPLPFGPPVIDAVPTGIAYSDGQLLVTLFRGFPFLVGSSVVEQVDPVTGAHMEFITGLSSAIDVLSFRSKGDTDHLVLQFSADMLAGAPGGLLRFETPTSAPSVIADCLITPTSMTLDEKTDTVYITELETGRVVSIHIAP